VVHIFSATRKHSLPSELSVMYTNKTTFGPVFSIVDPSQTILKFESSDKIASTPYINTFSSSEIRFTPPPCPYIVSFYDAFVLSGDGDGTFAFAMEYMDGGSLENVVSNGGCQRESVLALISAQILRGLIFLNSKNIIHRDIKPSNILLSHEGLVKLSDFGIVAELEQNQNATTTFIGTPPFMSPERLSGDAYSYQSDVWSLGLTLATLALGRFPLEGVATSSYWGLLNFVQESDALTLPDTVSFSQLFRNFIATCLIKDPSMF
jgi:serine/threonine protein kinase